MALANRRDFDAADGGEAHPVHAGSEVLAFLAGWSARSTFPFVCRQAAGNPIPSYSGHRIRLGRLMTRLDGILLHFRTKLADAGWIQIGQSLMEAGGDRRDLRDLDFLMDMWSPRST